MPDQSGREQTEPGRAVQSPDAQRGRRHGVLSFRGAPVGAVQGGCLCFEGTRIPVDVILHFINGGDTDADILDHYPSLTQLDLDAARWFDAKWQIRRRRKTAPAHPAVDPQMSESARTQS